MPITPVVGPAGGGKSQYIEANRRPGDVLIDFTAIYVALSGVTRGADGKYPEREEGDPLVPLTAALRNIALAHAVEQELDGFVTSASRRDVPRLERVTGQTATIIDPGEQTIIARLSEVPSGGGRAAIGESCATAAGRWYVDPSRIQEDDRGRRFYQIPGGQRLDIVSRPGDRVGQPRRRGPRGRRRR